MNQDLFIQPWCPLRRHFHRSGPADPRLGRPLPRGGGRVQPRVLPAAGAAPHGADGGAVRLRLPLPAEARREEGRGGGGGKEGDEGDGGGKQRYVAVVLIRVFAADTSQIILGRKTIKKSYSCLNVSHKVPCV